MGRYLNPYMVAFIVVLEGFFSGLLVTFVILNWVTTDDVSSQLIESNSPLIIKKNVYPCLSAFLRNTFLTSESQFFCKTST